jgi:HlyD family secretion protein
MSDLIFKGNVDESEVGKLKEGMPVSMTVGAIEGVKFDGKLEYISPKGLSREGTIEFEVWASIELKPGQLIRANYSANADIILDKRQKVLAIDESLITFEKGKPFVEVASGEQVFQKRSIQLGLSDGIKVEVKEGLKKGTEIKSKEKEKDGETKQSKKGH